MLAQRRQPDRQHVQAVEEIAAERVPARPPPRDCDWSPRRRARRRGCRPAPPTRLKLFSSRNRSSFACSAGTISPISSRNTVPPSALSSRPRFCSRRVRERAALVAEELALEQLFGQRRTGDVHEGRAARGRCCSGWSWRRGPCPVPLSPVSSTVDAGLAATLATICRSAVHRLRLADDGAERVRPRLVLAQLPDLAPQLGGLERARDQRGDLVDVERLVGEVEGAELHRLDRGLDADERGQQDDEACRDPSSSARAAARGRRCRAGDSRAARDRRRHSGSAPAPPCPWPPRGSRTRRSSAARAATSESGLRRRRPGSSRQSWACCGHCPSFRAPADTELPRRRPIRRPAPAR